MQRVPLLPLVVAFSIVGLGLVTAFYPYPHPMALLSVETLRTTYAMGEPIGFTVSLWLGGNAPVTFVGSPCAPLAYAIDQAGDQIYHSMHGVGCFAAIVERTLQPGERITLPFTWMQVNNSGMSVPAGQEYEIVPVLWTWSPIQVSIRSVQIVIN
jgi:hypothetical protein